MNRAELKAAVAQPDLRMREARSAQEFMERKGFKAKPFGLVQVDGAAYFYYEIPNAAKPNHIDLVELEVVADAELGWRRTVTCFREEAD